MRVCGEGNMWGLNLTVVSHHVALEIFQPKPWGITTNCIKCPYPTGQLENADLFRCSTLRASSLQIKFLVHRNTPASRRLRKRNLVAFGVLRGGHRFICRRT